MGKLYVRFLTSAGKQTELMPYNLIHSRLLRRMLGLFHQGSL
jgi:hypothetical protein